MMTIYIIICPNKLDQSLLIRVGLLINRWYKCAKAYAARVYKQKSKKRAGGK